MTRSTETHCNEFLHKELNHKTGVIVENAERVRELEVDLQKHADRNANMAKRFGRSSLHICDVSPTLIGSQRKVKTIRCRNTNYWSSVMQNSKKITASNFWRLTICANNCKRFDQSE